MPHYTDWLAGGQLKLPLLKVVEIAVTHYTPSIGNEPALEGTDACYGYTLKGCNGVNPNVDSHIRTWKQKAQ